MVVRINGKVAQRQTGTLSDGDVHAVGFPAVRVNGLPIALVGQLTTGHAGFPPTPAIEGSPDVKVAGTPIVRFGDAYAPHSDGSSVHQGFATPQ